MQEKIRAVLFDLDGTLADTLLDLANAMNHALEQFGCPIHPPDAYRYFVGDGARNLCRRALPADRPDLVEPALQLMRAYYEVHCFDHTRLYPGVTDLVTTLAQRGYLLAVLSNKPDDFTRRMIAHYFQPSPFALVRGQMPGGPLKPDPAGALSIAAQLSVPPAAWAYVGDTNTDMRTARAAGMYPVGVLWGFRDRAELEASGAAAIVATPWELLELLPPIRNRSD